jgi:hypothetical protein
MKSNRQFVAAKNQRPPGLTRLRPVKPGGLFALALFAGLLLSGCPAEQSTSPIEAPPDTSYLRVFDVDYRALSYREPYNSGVHIWWKEYFYSNYDTNCAINRYLLLNSDDTVFDKSWQNRFIPHGDTNIARTKWIDLADSAVEGRYRLRIFYRHSQRPFIFDTTFSVVVNYDPGGNDTH